MLSRLSACIPGLIKDLALVVYISIKDDMSWVFWLGVEALATLYYHAFIVGWTVYWLSHGWELRPSAYVAAAHEHQQYANSIRWKWSIPIFVFCFIAGMLTCKKINFDELLSALCRRLWQICKRRPPPTSALEEPFLDTTASGGGRDPTSRGSSSSTASQAGRHTKVEKRLEFLLIGFGHGFLCFVRTVMYRWKNPSSLEAFHKDLRYTQHLTLPVSHRTLLDEAYKQYQRLEFADLELQTLGLTFVLLAVFCEGRLFWSRLWVVVVGLLGLWSIVLPLYPNYTSLAAVDSPFVGCAPEFDKYMAFLVKSVAGSGIAACLGVDLFVVLFTLPISAVRAVWLMLVRGEGCAQDWNKDRTGTEVMILSAALRLIAFLTPLLTVFSLMYFGQVAQDSRWSRRSLFAFWLLPSVGILLGREYYRGQYFYITWLTVYLGTFLTFVYQQKHMHIGYYLKHADWPLLWSMMHAEFGVANVFFTDMIVFMLSGIDAKFDSLDTVEDTEKPKYQRWILHSIDPVEGDVKHGDGDGDIVKSQDGTMAFVREANGNIAVCSIKMPESDLPCSDEMCEERRDEHTSLIEVVR